MFEILFSASYLTGLVMDSFIRAWYVRKHRQDRKAIFREEGLIVGSLASHWGLAILLPLVYIFTRWLSFADFAIPTWISWVGVVIFAFSYIYLLISLKVALFYDKATLSLKLSIKAQFLSISKAISAYS